MYRVRKALTLIEVLIIIVIMLILAKIVVPKLSQASTDTREETLRSSLRLLREQISKYRDDHNGCPDGDQFVLQLTMRTDQSGRVMPPDGNIREYPFGPYLRQMPENPFVNRRLARRVEVGLATGGGGNAGWYYNSRSGALYPDSDAHSDL